MILVVNRVRTVPSAKLGKLFKGLNKSHCLSVFLFLCLVVVSIFHPPESDLYEHFFWQLTV